METKKVMLFENLFFYNSFNTIQLYERGIHDLPLKIADLLISKELACYYQNYSNFHKYEKLGGSKC